MKIVSNASPLINLARIGKLGLLRVLYGELIVPDAVWQEVVVEGVGQPGADEVEAAKWIKTQAATNRELEKALQQELDAGEAGAIALAIEKGADLLLMDEHLGREVAFHFGLHYTGLVGILIEAKRKGQIRLMKSLLDLLRDRAGFRISDELYHRVLRDEGEI